VEHGAGHGRVVPIPASPAAPARDVER
jgi:hypothetical protein